MKITAIHGLNDYKSKDGLLPIYIKVNIGSKRKFYPVGIKIKKSEWDERAQRVLNNRVNSGEINIKIINIKSTIEREYIKDNNIDIANIIQSVINPQPKKEYTLITYFSKYIQDCKDKKILHGKTNQPLTKGYIKTLETSLGRIESFATDKNKELKFNDITPEFHISFVNYLRHDYEFNEVTGLAENSISKTTKQIKTIMLHAMKKSNLHNNMMFLDFIAPYYEVDNIALTTAEVDLIINANLSSYPHLIEEQERFIIAYNFLLRFGDSISIQKKNIFFNNEKPFLKMVTQKTGQEVIIPIKKKSFDILQKNNFKMAATTNQESNEKVKKIGDLVGITDDYTVTEIRGGKKISTTYKRWELITTHTTRRSAATNQYLDGVDLKSIQLMGGWKSMKQLEEYLKIDKLQNAINVSKNKHFD